MSRPLFGPGARAARSAPAAAVVAATVLAGALACGGDAPTTPVETSPAYDPRGAFLDDFGQLHLFLYHWPVGTTVRVYVDPSAAPAGSDLRSAVVDGASRWTASLRQHEVAVAVSTDPRDADVVVHYGEAPRIVGSTSCEPASTGGSGVTFACPDFDAGAFEVLPLLSGAGGRVKMDVAVYHGGASSEAEFRRLVAHELGHVLGIGAHSESREDLMYGAPAVDAPSAADVKTLRYVLQQPADVRL